MGHEQFTAVTLFWVRNKAVSVCVREREAVLNESFIVYNYTLMFCADQV